MKGFHLKELEKDKNLHELIKESPETQKVSGFFVYWLTIPKIVLNSLTYWIIQIKKASAH